MPKQKVNLVTGASSAIGKRIVKELLDRGDEVRVLIKKDHNATMDTLSLPSGVKPYAADITLSDKADKKSLEAACEGIDRIFHFASATYNYRYSFDEMIATNVAGTENLLQAYLDSNPESSCLHFLFASTTSVYGYRRKGEILTEESPVKPGSNYAETKLMAEQVIKSFEEAAPKRIKFTMFRLGPFYGEGYEKPFFKVFRLVQEGRMIYIGGGRNNIVLVNIDDAVQAIMLALDNKKAENQIFNVTDGKSHTIKSLLEFTAEKLKVEAPKRSIPRFVAGIGRKIAKVNYDEFEFLSSDRVISISKAKKDLGYTPKVNLAKAGANLIDKFLETQKMKVSK